ncbi:HLH-domain-containing protein, partial [Metschnikowia bicuspidata var. bicuspidata NRRL YB-4993]
GDHHSKKVKLGDSKKDDIAIDSELLGDQSSYSAGSGTGTENNKHDEDDEDAAVAAAASLVSDAETANAAAAALSHQQPHYHHHHHLQLHQQQQQQLHQKLAYESHYSQQLHAASAVNAAQQHHRSDNTILQPTTLPQQNSGNKPSHGSEEWHRARRENHKEVERRRRDSINQGIKELAQLIPSPDTNKAQILQRGIEYIRRLKENENNNIEKWTLEKLLTEQAVSELNASNEKLKSELEKAYREIE